MKKKEKEIDYSWRLKTYKKTYILAGKLNNKPFIMVDKVKNFNPNKPAQNKLYHSISNPNITISLTGNTVLINAIKKHDETLLQQGEILTINENLINEFAIALEMKYDSNFLDKNFVYVIDKDSLRRYDLKFSINNPAEYDNCTSININNGEFLYNTNNQIRTLPDSANVEYFSKLWLRKIYAERYKENDEAYDINKYFKKGFSFFTV